MKNYFDNYTLYFSLLPYLIIYLYRAQHDKPSGRFCSCIKGEMRRHSHDEYTHRASSAKMANNYYIAHHFTADDAIAASSFSQRLARGQWRNDSFDYRQ